MADDHIIEFRLLVDSRTDLDDAQSRFAAAIETGQDFKIEKIERTKPFGMTGTEVAISFVVSVASSALVHIARDRIDAAARLVSQAIKKPVRVSFKRTEVTKDGSADESKEPRGTSSGD